MSFNAKIKIFLFLCFIFSCKGEEKKNDKPTQNKPEVKLNGALESFIDTLTIDDSYSIDDVRRYGLMPDKTIGAHPKTKKPIIEQIISLANKGQELNFPKGYFKTALNLSDASGVKLNFNNTEFSGGIIIKGTKDSPVENIDLNGKLATYSTFSCSFIDNVSIDSLIIRNYKEKNISKIESSGCNIYTGSTSLYIDYLEIEGTGSDSDQFRYTPAALMVHGKSPEPIDILLKEVLIKSSDRHGAYLSGNTIDIEKLKIESYGQGKVVNMLPIAYTKRGDEKKITGLWLFDFNNSTINDLEINTQNSPKAVDALYLDNGDGNYISNIFDLNITGNRKNIRKSQATNIKIAE